VCLFNRPFGVLLLGLVVGLVTFLNGSCGVLWLGVVVRCATLLNGHATLLDRLSYHNVVRMVSVAVIRLACSKDQIARFRNG
jgi:hypothetical protein